MPVLKPISGHTSCKGPYRYLTKNGRALESDYINIEAPEVTAPGNVFPWWKQMDATRHRFGHDRPWGGRAPRTYKHYIISPDPEDGIGLESLRSLATEWAEKHFREYECAIVYHDDNENRIPHAHVIVNCTNLETGKKLQDPDPTNLSNSLQKIARGQSLRHFRDTDEILPGEDRQKFVSKHLRPQSHQYEYERRAEAQLREQGQYSWVADIRARVKVARAAAHSEAEFRSLLGALGVDVSNNSAKAARADWIYSLSDAPTRRVSGEKLGLAYGRESLLARFDAALPAKGADIYAQRLADIAKQAVAVADLAQLQRLADAVTLIERGQIRSSIALDAYMRRPYQKQAWNDLDAAQAKAAQEFIKEAGVLPFRTQRSGSRTGRTSQEAYADTRPARRSEQTEDDGALSRQQEGRSAQAHVRARNDQER